MENALVKSETHNVIADLNNIQAICEKLMSSNHYKKMSADGVMAIVHKATSLGVHPMDALNGGMYFVQGRVEMSAILMARLIRQQKHSITMDKSSNGTICILHGRRVDNGDTWRASFSLDDARRAGLLKAGSTWEKYPDIMCYNRALSKLARQLFPDVIGNCYIEGEIVESFETKNDKKDQEHGTFSLENLIVQEDETITEEQADALDKMIGNDDSFRATVLDFVQKRFGTADFRSIRADAYKGIYDKVVARCAQKETVVTVESVENVSEIVN